MDSDQGKLFIGGISWETSEDKLKEYFGNYGDIIQAVVMRDKLTGKPRGFGFVVFSDPSVLDTLLQEKHIIDGRTVDAKRALSREEQQVSKAGNPNGGRSFGGGSGGGGNIKTKKIFVGGLPPTLTEEGFRQYFEAYGHVTDVVVMYDQQTNRPRGFGFISFDAEDAVDRVLHKTFHDLDGKQVEVKRALPKDLNPGGGRGGSSGGAGGGSFPGYGGSGSNSNSYENRMDSNRYMQSQTTGGGFPAFGYGYGSANTGGGYNGYGGYGGGAAAAAAYGNPSAGNAGYGGAQRNSWNNSVGYGGGAQWGGPNSGGQVQAGQSPAGGYGNQGYGYSGIDGSYGNPPAYGAVGGRIGSMHNSNSSGSGGGDLQSGGGGYMGGNYGDASQGWRSDPYGSQAGYGGGYGGAQGRQAQQQ